MNTLKKQTEALGNSLGATTCHPLSILLSTVPICIFTRAHGASFLSGFLSLSISLIYLSDGRSINAMKVAWRKFGFQLISFTSLHQTQIVIH